MKKMMNVLLAVTLLAALVSTTGVNVFANEEVVATDANTIETEEIAIEEIEEVINVEEELPVETTIEETVTEDVINVEEELPTETIIEETVTEKVAGVTSVEEEQLVEQTSRSTKQSQIVTVTFTLDDENDGKYFAINGPLKTTLETTVGSKIE